MLTQKLKTDLDMKSYACGAIASLLLFWGCEDFRSESPDGRNERVVLGVDIASDGERPGCRTVLGGWDEAAGHYDVWWNEGDRISVNGVSSEPLDAVLEKSVVADFVLNGVHPPYRTVYPAGIVTSVDGTSVNVNIPSSQKYVENSFAAGAQIMYGLSDDESVTLSNACGVVKVGLVRQKRSAGMRCPQDILW